MYTVEVKGLLENPLILPVETLANGLAFVQAFGEQAEQQGWELEVTLKRGGSA